MQTQEVVTGSSLDPTLTRWMFSDAQQTIRDIVVANDTVGTSESKVTGAKKLAGNLPPPA